MSTKTTIVYEENLKFSDGTVGSIHIYHDFIHEKPIRLEFEGLGISIQATIDDDDKEQLLKFIDKVYNGKKMLGI